MDKFADLHIHTYFSDSSSSPQEVINDAVKAQLSCIAITDHDTIDGVELTRQLAQKHDIEVLNGIELSSEFNGKDIHILGYCFKDQNGELKILLAKIQAMRIERVKLMIEKLNKLGIKNIAFEEVKALTQSDAIGRPHLARIMVEKGVVSDFRQAFDKYLAEDGAAYVPKYKMSPQEAIKVIRDLGGVSVMAHPMVTSKDEIIPQLVKSGLQGIEVFYPNFSQSVIDYYLKIAQKNNLVATGGSDAHGNLKKNTFVGKKRLEYSYVEKLKALAK